MGNESKVPLSILAKIASSTPLLSIPMDEAKEVKLSNPTPLKGKLSSHGPPLT